MSDIEWVDCPPDGWLVLDVMKLKMLRKWDWWALMIDVTIAIPGAALAHPFDFQTSRASATGSNGRFLGVAMWQMVHRAGPESVFPRCQAPRTPRGTSSGQRQRS